MHTILGANGTIAQELSRALISKTTHIRQVSRHPAKVNQTDELCTADLLDAEATSKAVAGSDVVYLVAGLPYKASVWHMQWPRVMDNVINACLKHKAHLIFFDNVYAYGHVDGVMTEETPFNPCSKKGEVRAKIATQLLEEIQRGELTAMIVRAADFYGPNAILSFPHGAIFERLKAGKSPQWIGKTNKIHTFTYTPDAGQALAILGNTSSAFGQTWHLPTSKEQLTGAGFLKLACDIAGSPHKWQVAPRWMLKIMGTFMPILRENDEMMYQFEFDYRFDSSKIESKMGIKATSYEDGIRESLKLKSAAPA